MRTIDVRFTFDTEEENGYTHYNLRSVERIETDIPEDAMVVIGETLAQSDHWNVGGVGATLDAMTSEGPKVLREYW